MSRSPYLAGLALACFALAAPIVAFAPPVPPWRSLAFVLIVAGFLFAIASFVVAIAYRRGRLWSTSRRSRFPVLVGVLISSASLAGCASLGLGGGALTPAQQVFALEGVLTSAVNVATYYAGLPACSSPPAGLCSDPGTVAKLRAAAPAAQEAVLAAEVVVTKGDASKQAQAAALANAQAAVAGLTSITQAIPAPAPKPS